LNDDAENRRSELCAVQNFHHKYKFNEQKQSKGRKSNRKECKILDSVVVNFAITAFGGKTYQ